MNVTKQQYSQPISCQGQTVSIYTVQECWQVAGQEQLHSLNRLNLFILCVCAFTYLPSSIIFTADNE